MSFFTSLKYYRPTAPPVVTPGEVAQSLRRFAAAGLIGAEGWMSVKVKLGQPIDSDVEEMDPMVETDVPGIATMERTEAEIDENQGVTFEGILAALERTEQKDQTIYRGFIGFGLPSDAVVAALQTERPGENGGKNLSLNSWSLEFGLALLMSMESEPVAAGWISLSLGGPGYLYPSTIKELVGRAEALPELQVASALCRETWPVAAGATLSVLDGVAPALRPAKLRRIRKKLGELWPYEDLDRPVDWAWGVAETG